jgi:hypothetical protein
MAGGAGDRSELLLRTGNGKFARLLRLQEVADAETGPGIPFVATNHMHMGMEDVLAAGGSDIPSDRKTVRLELIKPAFCLRKHFTEVGPFLRAELEWCLDMTERNDHRGWVRQGRLQHYVLRAIARCRLASGQAVCKTLTTTCYIPIHHADCPTS